jgi:hypothetical protein
MPMLLFSPATYAEFYKTCLPQLTRRPSANCLLPIVAPSGARQELVAKLFGSARVAGSGGSILESKDSTHLAKQNTDQTMDH